MQKFMAIGFIRFSVFCLIFQGANFSAYAEKKTSADPNLWPNSYLFKIASEREKEIEAKLNKKDMEIAGVKIFSKKEYGKQTLLLKHWRKTLNESAILAEHHFIDGKTIKQIAYLRLEPEVKKINEGDLLEMDLYAYSVGHRSFFISKNSTEDIKHSRQIGNLEFNVIDKISADQIGLVLYGDSPHAVFQIDNDNFLIAHSFAKLNDFVSLDTPYVGYYITVPASAEGEGIGYSYSIDRMRWEVVSRIQWKKNSRTAAMNEEAGERLLHELVEWKPGSANFIALENFQAPSGQILSKIKNSTILGAAAQRAAYLESIGLLKRDFYSLKDDVSCEPYFVNAGKSGSILTYLGRVQINGQAIETLYSFSERLNPINNCILGENGFTTCDFSPASGGIFKVENPENFDHPILYGTFNHIRCAEGLKGLYLGRDKFNPHYYGSNSSQYDGYLNNFYSIFDPFQNKYSSEIFKINIDTHKHEPAGFIQWQEMDVAPAKDWKSAWEVGVKAQDEMFLQKETAAE